MTSDFKKINLISDKLLDLALAEDLGTNWHDLTTDALFAKSSKIYQTKIISKNPEPITICGVEFIHHLFKKINPDCKIIPHYQDGQQLLPGETLLTLESDGCTLLKGERTALNFLRHLSAIATLTAQYVHKIKHTQLKLLDTRKTTPGMRYLEKYAVHCGGGVNHRMGLYDAYMVKDTHVDLIGGMKETLKRLPNQAIHHLPVIVEVRSLAELADVLDDGQQKVTRILFDNMGLGDIQQGVSACQGIYDTEASGNIDLDNITDIAQTGVQFASVGKITYAAGQVDLSMLFATNAP